MFFRAQLTEAGLALQDTAVLCAQYSAVGDWQQVRQQAFKENLLGKGSQERIKKLLKAVERRIVSASPPLNYPLPIARFLAAEIGDAAKAQILFVLAVREDPALADAYQRLVVPALLAGLRKPPSRDAVLQYLESVAQAQPEVAKWSANTRIRWSQGFRLVLREAGMISGQGSTEVLSPLVPREQTISFLCHAVAQGTQSSGWAILRHEVLRVLLLTDADAVRAARDLRDRGWWTFAQSGDIVEFRPNHGTLEDWMNHVLG